MVATLMVGTVVDVHAGTNFNVQVSGTMGQTEARTMLAMVNSFRQSSDAWYWNSDNATKTTCSGLGTLSYDYNLEKIAMQRAVEVALYFDHGRPNGTKWSGLTYNGTKSYGENISAGYTSANAAYIGWREDNDMYSGQGHRRNMLSAGFTAVGIGHFYYNGYHYWVQEFGYSNSGAASTVADDANGLRQVEVNTDLTDGTTVLLSSRATNITNTVDLGSTTSLPTPKPAIHMTESWPGSPCPVEGIATAWSSSDSSVVSISGSTYVANKIGTAVLTCQSALGGEGTLTVTVKGVSLSGATINLSSTTYEYTGSAVTPQITSVTLNGRSLVQGIDYTVAYSNNTSQGTGKVTVTGIGNYSGSVSKNFTIKCSHLSTIGKRYDSTWHRKVCSLCGQTMIYESHTLSDYVLVSKTPSQEYEGLYEFRYEKTCSGCDYKSTQIITKADETVTPPDEPNPGNQTPDNPYPDNPYPSDQTPSQYVPQPSVDRNPDAEASVNAFVNRMYTVVLGRPSEAEGQAYWADELLNLKMDGAGVAGGFINSDEFRLRGLDNSAYLDVLYKTFFNRASDADGKNYWMSCMASGMSRNEVLSGFVNSQEFAQICDDYGIARGMMKPDGSSNYNAGARNYVLRMYTKALGRAGETMGVEYWTDQIVQGTVQPVTVAKEFFFSQEYLSKNLDNLAYLDTLYETFMGRSSDDAGKSYWLQQMLYYGMSREKVLEEFSVSQEFRQIMASYGL